MPETDAQLAGAIPITALAQPDDAWPDRNAEYLLYQTLVGAWPIEPERVQQYMEKAGREGKEMTTWTAPDPAYEGAMRGFIDGVLADATFTGALAAFVERIQAAGWVNSLAQTLLKLTSPGVPDIYQGADLWNFALVDPDNRRPVDYRLRAALLAELDVDPTPEEIWQRRASSTAAGLFGAAAASSSAAGLFGAAAASSSGAAASSTGLPKLWVIRQALALRRAHPEWFGVESTYTPLRVDQDAAVAYLRGGGAGEPGGAGRSDGGGGSAGQVAVIAPRLSLRFRERWGELAVDLPAARWQNWLTGEAVPGGRVPLAEIFRRFPAALLVSA